LQHILQRNETLVESGVPRFSLSLSELFVEQA